MNHSEMYVLGQRPAEHTRLQQQARDLAGESEWMFDEISIAPGAQVVEIGCGPQGCLALLAARVGPSGRVLGIERDVPAAALARQWAAEGQLDNVQVVCGDGRHTGMPRGEFDLVTSRLVLVNVPDPSEIIAEAVALVKPGGAVAFHEADYLSHVCDPPCAAWTRLVDLLMTYCALHGIDAHIGRKLPRLLREAGLQDVQVRPLVHVYPPGSPRRNILLEFAENVGDRLIQAGLVLPDELARLQGEVQRHLECVDTLVVSHLFFQAWGRKPG